MTGAIEAAPPPPSRLDQIVAQLREHFQRHRSLTRAFLHWDADRNGRLSRAELAQLVDDQGVRHVTDADLDALYARMLGPDRCIRYGDFVRVLAPVDDDVTTTTIWPPGEKRPPRLTPAPPPIAADRAIHLLAQRMRSLARPTTAVRAWCGGQDGVIDRSRAACALDRYNMRLDDAQLEAFISAFGDQGVIPVGAFIQRMLHDDDDNDDKPPRAPWRPQSAAAVVDPDGAVRGLFRALHRRFGDNRARLFRYLDEDGDGYVTVADLRRRLRSRSPSALERLVGADGVAFAEFAALMGRIEADPEPVTAPVPVLTVPRSQSTNHIAAPDGAPAFANADERFDRCRRLPEPIRRGRRRPNRRRSASYLAHNRSSPVVRDNVGVGGGYDDCR